MLSEDTTYGVVSQVALIVMYALVYYVLSRATYVELVWCMPVKLSAFTCNITAYSRLHLFDTHCILLNAVYVHSVLKYDRNLCWHCHPPVFDFAQ